MALPQRRQGARNMPSSKRASDFFGRCFSMVQGKEPNILAGYPALPYLSIAPPCLPQRHRREGAAQSFGRPSASAPDLRSRREQPLRPPGHDVPRGPLSSGQARTDRSCSRSRHSHSRFVAWAAPTTRPAAAARQSATSRPRRSRSATTSPWLIRANRRSSRQSRNQRHSVDHGGRSDGIRRSSISSHHRLRHIAPIARRRPRQLQLPTCQSRARLGGIIHDPGSRASVPSSRLGRSLPQGFVLPWSGRPRTLLPTLSALTLSGRNPR